jgi:flagellar motor switch protein FliM
MNETPSQAPAGAEPSPDDAIERMAAAAARDYDLSVEERLVRRPMPTLDAVNERFSRSLRLGLFHLMRRSPEIAIEPVAVQRFSELLGLLQAPINFNIVALRPLRGSGLVICDATLISAMVDAMYGGAGKLHSSIEGRDFSPTEQRVIQRLLAVVCAEYGKAWKDVYPLQLEYERSETHAQFLSIAAPADLMVVTTVQITVGSFSGAIRICKPYAALDPIREVLYGVQQARAMAEDRRWVTLLTREIQAAEVTLVAELAQPEITVGQLLAMKAGDFIQLDRAPRVVASVDGTPVFSCRYGTHNARYALRIEESLRSDDTHWLGGSHVH